MHRAERGRREKQLSTNQYNSLVLFLN